MKTKRRNIKVKVLAGMYAGKDDIVLATDTIARIEPVVGTAPIHMEGARAIIFFKGKDEKPLFAMEERDEILAKIEAPEPTDRFALMRFKRATKKLGYYAWFDLVAIVPKAFDSGVIGHEYVVRTPDGIKRWAEEEFWPFVNSFEYEEV